MTAVTEYQQAVTRLIAAAEVVAEYRADLAAFADTLDGKRWGVDVTGPIKDMDGKLTGIEGDYRDLAGQMKHQGDQGAAAHEQAPWVPDTLLADEAGCSFAGQLTEIPSAKETMMSDDSTYDEDDEDDEEDRSGEYRLWEQGYRSEYTLYSSLDELLTDLKAMATPEADDENKIYPGRFVVQKWETKEMFDAVEFLAAHGVTVPEDYDPPSTLYRLYYDKQQPYSYMAFDNTGELVDEYYGQGIDIGIRRKQSVLNKATGEVVDIVDVLATTDFTTISLPKYDVWQTRYSGQREVPMEIQTDTIDNLMDELVSLERRQESGTIEPGVMSIFDYSTGKESDVAAFLKKNRKLIKEARDRKPS